MAGFYYSIHQPVQHSRNWDRPEYTVREQARDHGLAHIRIARGEKKLQDRYKELGIWYPPHLPRSFEEAAGALLNLST